jgi:NifU-like protein involved in Fe-S cluster formation
VKPPLQQLASTAEGAGELGGDGVVSGRAEHPVCGDEVEITWRLATGVIADLRWRARGCPATLAVAAAASSALRGVALRDARSTLRRRLASLGDLAVHERHAEALFLRALGAP